MTWWPTTDARCDDCGCRVVGAQLVDGNCPSCFQEGSGAVYSAPVGPFGHRHRRRNGQPWRHNGLRGQVEADLRWFFNDAAGDLGIRAISVTSHLLAPDQNFARSGDGVWRAKPTRTVVVREMSIGQMVAAARCRDVFNALAKISKRQVRVLQRRYDQSHYYAELDTIFGEWSGLVDYINPDVTTECKPREGKRPPERVVERNLNKAKQSFLEAITAYEKALRAG